MSPTTVYKSAASIIFLAILAAIVSACLSACSSFEARATVNPLTGAAQRIKLRDGATERRPSSPET